MLYIQFLQFVQERSGLSAEEARTGIQAVFEVMGEGIGADLAELLAETLPAELRSGIPREPWPKPFHASEFIERVARSQDMDLPAIEGLVRSVLSVVADYLPSIELLIILKHLPKDLRHLFKQMDRAA